MRALWCRLMRHHHGAAYILCTTVEGDPIVSHEMEEWSAEWIVTNLIMPTAHFAGRDIASCRIVVR
jgi:hypothetical protein